MQLTSDAFTQQTIIPDVYTCKGTNVNPDLRVTDVPVGTKSLAIIMHDPDAPNGDFLHWTLWNIDPTQAIIAENSVPAPIVQGKNDFGTVGYGGPCPPSGTHRYVLDAYALDVTLSLPAGSDRATLEAALRGHILETAQLVGLVSAPE